jgi:hypothetical protein
MAAKSSTKEAPHKWGFKTHFRRGAFGSESGPPIARIKEAVSEIKKVGKKSPKLAAEGAVAFLERVSAALAGVDTSSEATGAAVNHAIADLVVLICKAEASAKIREGWLERLFVAYLDDGMACIESLGEHWGALCASPQLASAWADRLLDPVKLTWGQEPALRGSTKSTTPCLSALLASERYDDVLALLDALPHHLWRYHQFGVTTLLKQGKVNDALAYVERERGNDGPTAVARVCEEILLGCGQLDEAYTRYGLTANQGGTYLATFRAVTKKYPHKAPGQVLLDLVATTPGDEGKWFAAAKSAGLYDEAIALATRSPSAPQTLTRAARDYAEEQPTFAFEAGLLALQWLAQGYGYEVTEMDIWDAYGATGAAAKNAGRGDEVKDRVRKVLAVGGNAAEFVSRVLRRDLND